MAHELEVQARLLRIHPPGAEPDPRVGSRGGPLGGERHGECEGSEE